MQKTWGWSGASCNQELMHKRCRYELFVSHPTMSATHAVMPELLAQETLLTVLGDGAYDTQLVYEAVMQRNSTTMISPRKNAKLRKDDAFGHKLWKNWSGYHRGSLVEVNMHCIKRVMSRTFERSVNGLRIRAAILNRFLNWAARRRWLWHSGG